MASSRKIRAGKSDVELGIRDRLAAGLAKARKRLQAFGSGIAKIGGGITAAGGAVSSVFLGSAKKFADFGDSIEKMSARTGASAKRLSELAFAAERSGTDISKVEAGYRGMARTLLNANDGLTTSVDSLNALGVNLEDLNGMNPDQQFLAIADAISKIQDPTKRAGLAMRVFGKSGTDLLPMFAGGSKGIQDLAKEADRLGLTLGTKDAAAAAKLTDALGDMASTFKGVFIQIGAAVAGPLTDFANRIASGVSMVIEFIRNNQALVSSVAAVAAGLVVGGTVLTGMGFAAMGAAAGIGAITAAAAALASPLAIAGALILGASGYFIAFTETGQAVVEWFGSNFVKLKEIVASTVGGMSDAIQGGDIALAGRIAFTGFKLAMAEVLEKVLDLFGTNIAEMSKMVARIIKQIGQIVAAANNARADASSTLAQWIGSAFGIDVKDADSFAKQNAKAFEKRVTSIDTSKLGDSIRDSLDPELLEKQLAELKKEAKQAADARRAAQTEAGPKVSKFEANIPGAQLAAANRANESLKNFSSFAGARIDAARSGPGAKAIPEKQLAELKNQSEKLDEMNATIKKSKLVYR